MLHDSIITFVIPTMVHQNLDMVCTVLKKCAECSQLGAAVALSVEKDGFLKPCLILITKAPHICHCPFDLLTANL